MFDSVGLGELEDGGMINKERIRVFTPSLSLRAISMVDSLQMRTSLTVINPHYVCKYS